MTRGIAYLPLKLKAFPELPEGFKFAVEVHIPGKEVQTKPFHTEEKARAFLAEVRKLQEKAVLYARLIRNDDGIYQPESKRLRLMPPVKGKMYCYICNDYTVFHNKFGWEYSDAKHCQYCSISDNDWYIKGLNGLWDGMRLKR